MASDGFPATIVAAFTAVYFLIFLPSIVGNSFVLSVCYGKLKRQVSSLKFFIANLAAADLTFTVLTILNLIMILWTWVGGQWTCRLQSFLIEACYTASIMTLVLISYERRKARVMVQDGTHRKIISVWVVSLLVDLPLLYAHDVEQDDSGVISCDNMVLGDLGRQIYYCIHAVFFFSFSFDIHGLCPDYYFSNVALQCLSEAKCLQNDVLDEVCSNLCIRNVLVAIYCCSNIDVF